MPAPVFYSVCPFGTGTIETGAGNISITSGVATLTVEQTGNIGTGVCIEYNSLSCYIAPNRIGFDSGGTTELLLDTKISGATSSATGIIRFVEVTSGTWAGGDAAGWIYFEKTTGTFQNNENINRTKPTVSNNIATINGTIEGNIGNGNTQFVVKSAIGGTPANQTATAVTSIHHEYASLSDFEAGFIDASHINNTNLTLADVVALACRYYDHDDYTADSTTVIIEFGTPDATRFLICYTPVGDAESINKQRHSGKWDGNKSYGTGAVTVREPFTVAEGLQQSTGVMHWVGAATPPTITACILKATTSASILRIDGDTSTEINVNNTIIYGDGVVATRCIYTCAISNDILLRLFFCTICGGNEGVDSKYSATNIEAQNNAVFNNTDDFVRGVNFSVCSYNASDDGDGTNAVDWTSEATDWANVFTDYANADFSLKNFTGTGTIIEQGIDLSSSEGIWRDIAGVERGATPDIGAFEYVAAAATGNPWNYYAQQ